MLSANVVTVGFENGTHRYLTHLRSAAHDNDPFPIDLFHGFHPVCAADDGKLAQIFQHGARIALRLNFKIRVIGAGLAARDDIHTDDISVVPRNYAGCGVQNPGAGGRNDFNTDLRIRHLLHLVFI